VTESKRKLNTHDRAATERLSGNVRQSNHVLAKEIAGWYGAMPLIVLTSEPVAKPRANETFEFRAALNRLHAVLADQMVALSTRGVLRPVANSTHEIQLSQPDAVNSAILEVLGEVRQK
jgi:hypothetical protein